MSTPRPSQLHMSECFRLSQAVRTADSRKQGTQPKWGAGADMKGTILGSCLPVQHPCLPQPPVPLAFCQQYENPNDHAIHAQTLLHEALYVLQSAALFEAPQI